MRFKKVLLIQELLYVKNLIQVSFADRNAMEKLLVRYKNFVIDGASDGLVFFTFLDFIIDTQSRFLNTVFA